jgi:hypothetical protein
MTKRIAENKQIQEITTRLEAQDKVLEETRKVQIETKNLQAQNSERLKEVIDILTGSHTHRTKGIRSTVETMETDFKILHADARTLKGDIESNKVSLEQMKTTVESCDMRLQKLENGNRFTWADIKTKIFAFLVGINTLLAVVLMIKELFKK